MHNRRYDSIELDKYVASCQQTPKNFSQRYANLLKNNEFLSASQEAASLLGKLDAYEDPISLDLPECPVSLPFTGGSGCFYFNYEDIKRCQHYSVEKNTHFFMNPLTREDVDVDLIKAEPELRNIIDELLMQLEKMVEDQHVLHEGKEKEKEKEKEKDDHFDKSQQVNYPEKIFPSASFTHDAISINSLSLEQRFNLALLNIRVDFLLKQIDILLKFTNKFEYNRSFRQRELIGLAEIRKWCYDQSSFWVDIAGKIHMQQINPEQLHEFLANVIQRQLEVQKHFELLFDKAKYASIGAVVEWQETKSSYKQFYDELAKLEKIQYSSIKNLSEWEMERIKLISSFKTAFLKTLLSRFQYDFSLRRQDTDSQGPLINILVFSNKYADETSLVERCCGGNPQEQSTTRHYNLMLLRTACHGQAVQVQFSNQSRDNIGEIASSAFRNFKYFMIVIDVDQSGYYKYFQSYTQEVNKFARGEPKKFVVAISKNPNQGIIDNIKNSCFDYHIPFFSVNPYDEHGGHDEMMQQILENIIEQEIEDSNLNGSESPWKNYQLQQSGASVSSSSTLVSSNNWYRSSLNWLNTQLNQFSRPRSAPPHVDRQKDEHNTAHGKGKK